MKSLRALGSACVVAGFPMACGVTGPRSCLGAGAVVTTLAGGGPEEGEGFADGDSRTARFRFPEGVAVDRAGVVYLADTGNNAIRKIDARGRVSTLAGGGPDAEGFVDGDGAAARFRAPASVAVDAAGTLYVADTGNNAIRKIDAHGRVTTLAGLGPVMRADFSGDIRSAKLEYTFEYRKPMGVATDGTDITYLDCSNEGGLVCGANGPQHAIRRIDSRGSVYLEGSAAPIVEYDLSPGANHDNMRELHVTTLPGRGKLVDGDAFLAQLSYPESVAVAVSGDVLVADTENDAIRRVDARGTVSTLASLLLVSGYPTVQVSNRRPGWAKFHGVAVSATGKVYVVDHDRRVVRTIGPEGRLSTVAGVPPRADDPEDRIVDGDASVAEFRDPADLAVDAAGNLYVADARNNAVRKISPAGVVTTVAGSGPKITHGGGIASTVGTSYGGGFVDGSGRRAQFFNPLGIAVDAAGNVYVADTGNNAVRKITVTPDP